MPDTRLPRTLVLGGAGFIGRHVVEALVHAAVPAIVGSRHPERADRRLADSARSVPRRRARFETLGDPARWASLLDEVDVVVNCVGILRERGRETWDAVHHRAPAALAVACRERGIALLHVSALGLDGPIRNGFLRSKRDGDQALCRSGVRGAIVRPSLLVAERGGYGAAWIRFAATLPWLPLPADATGRIAALDVRDLGEAIARLVVPFGAAGHTRGQGVREYGFGGPDAVPLAELVARLRRAAGRRPARVLPIPARLARFVAHACDLLHATPFSVGHHELLRGDNMPDRDDLPGVLGRAPRAVGAGAGSKAGTDVTAAVTPAGSAP